MMRSCVFARLGQATRSLVRCQVSAGNGRSMFSEDFLSVVSQDRKVKSGDLVSVHFSCKEKDGTIVDSSWERGSPLTFKVGAGQLVGNRLFQGFDEAVQEMEAGETRVFETCGDEWSGELLFKVPTTHPEIVRLQGRYKNLGGISKGMVVELLNKRLALVVDMDDSVVTLDANSMMAGKELTFEISVQDILTEDVL